MRAHDCFLFPKPILCKTINYLKQPKQHGFGGDRLLRDVNHRQEIQSIRSDLKTACESIRDEFNQHLDTINSNTDEIQQNYEYLAQIEQKLDKLAERMDAIEVHMNRVPKTNLKKIVLSHREQEIFIVLYSSPEKLTLRMIARKLGFTEEMVSAYLDNIIAKGVPVLRQVAGETFFFLDHNFRQLQAKNKVINIEESIVREIFAQ